MTNAPANDTIPDRPVPAWRKGLALTLAILLIGSLAWMTVSRMRPSAAPDGLSPFEREADLSPLSRVAVHHRGRLKSFDSFAYSIVRASAGPAAVRAGRAGHAYLDLLFQPEATANTDSVWVKSKVIRGLISDRLQSHPGWTEERSKRFIKTGLIAPSLLQNDPAVRDLLARLAQDMVRSAKFVEQIDNALTLRHPDILVDLLRILPPPAPASDPNTPWTSVAALTADGSGIPHNGAPEAIPAAGALAGMDAKTSATLIAAWADLANAWRAQDAPKASDAAKRLADALPALNPTLYPQAQKLQWESRYFALGNFTWVWLVYMAGVVFLLMAVVYRWSTARWIGIAFFLLALALHTGSIALRWHVSGRWPNSNMFEAVTTAAWFGAVASLLLELLARKSPMRNLFFLGAAACSMAALMAAHFLPLQLTPDIGNMMPILHDVWLYIHTNVIIFSYVLIAMAAVTALLYLLHRLAGGEATYAKVGGAGSLIQRDARKPRAAFGEVLDGATMLLMELSFVLLWAGIVMGAVWADHSWGRPWGWDPKEVFALNTFLIFAMLIHIRLKVRDKGLWTAVLASIGAGVMIFNWTVINFVITGLHSYA
ncbi:MAG: cytochrome c biogenesis protein CcsA [Phycisphaerales bacterium]